MREEGKEKERLGQPIRLGMVGGGQGAFIGAVHRAAARLGNQFMLVAGALSSDPERARTSAAELGLDPSRSYGSYIEMARMETERLDGIEAVSIVTPNHAHAPIAKAFLKAGIHVICDKPMTTTVADAEDLVRLVEASGKVFMLTHNYTGYPMIRQARAMVEAGDIGAIRLVQIEYAQDWLTEKAEAQGSKQAKWRTDPAYSGEGGSISDIGTHAYNLACFVSRLELECLACDLASFVEGRKVDDNSGVLLRFKGGAKGMLWASQVAVGNENALTLRLYGDKGGLDWSHEDPNKLWFTPFGQPKRLLTRGGAGSLPAALRVAHLPPGHPEGYLEGFATLYAEAARAIRAAGRGEELEPNVLYPTARDGLDGMRFIAAAVKSSRNNAIWTKV